MAKTFTSIVNQALSYLGSARINNLTNTDELTQIAVDNIYDARDTVLCEIEPRSALKAQVLNPRTDIKDPLGHYSYVYDKPADFLQTAKISWNQVLPYVVGDHFYSNYTPLSVYYISRIDNPNKLDIWVCDLIAWEFLIRAARRIKGDDASISEIKSFRDESTRKARGMESNLKGADRVRGYTDYLSSQSMDAIKYKARIT